MQPNNELGSALADALAPLIGGAGRDIHVTLQVGRRVLAREVVQVGLEAQSCT